MEPRRARAADLQVPQPTSQAAEPTVSFIVELGGQVAGLTKREMNAFVEVLPRLAVPPNHLIGHQGLQQGPELGLEGLVVGRQFDTGEVHVPSVTLSDRSVKPL